MTLTKSKKLSRKTTLLLFSVMCALLLIPVFAVVNHSAKASEIQTDYPGSVFYCDTDQGHIVDQKYNNQGTFYLYLSNDTTTNYFQFKESGQVEIHKYETGSSNNYFKSEFDQSNDNNANKVNEENSISNTTKLNSSDNEADPTIDIENGVTILLPQPNAGLTFDYWQIEKNGSVIGKAEPNINYTKNEGYCFVAKFKECGKLHGKVVNGGANARNESEPIEKCLVEFYNQNFYAKTYTNAQGEFNISADNDGGIIEISKLEYRSFIQQMTAEEVQKGEFSTPINLYTVANSVILSGNVYMKIDGEDPEPLGGAYIYYAPEGKQPISTKSIIAQRQRLPILNNENENNDSNGSYSLAIDKGIPGKLQVYISGNYTAAATMNLSAEDTSKDIVQDIYLEQSDEGVIVTFHSSDAGSIALDGEGGYSMLTGYYHKGDDVNIDWDTGIVSITCDGNVTTYTPVPNEGYAYYDWSIRDFNGSYIPFQFQDILKTNTRYTVSFRPAGKYIAASDDEHHKEFKCTHTSQEFPDKSNFHKGATLEEELYAGTEITLKDGKLVCRYTDPTETEYWKQDVIEGIGQDGYVVEKYLINGVEFTEGQSLTVAQFDTVNISATYRTASAEEILANAQTGDYLMIIGLMLGLIALGSGIYVVRKRSKN